MPRTVVAATLVAAVLSAAWVAPLWAQPRLAVRDMVFEQPLPRVGVIEWRGAPAVLVLAAVPAPVAPGEPLPVDLVVVQVRGGKLVTAGRWRLPREVRWVEPLRTKGGVDGWLGLIGAAWFFGRVQGEELRWSLLCRCETLFSAGVGPLPATAQFVYDLDGDGDPEVLLPHWQGLIAYRIAPDGSTLRPLWRDRWEIREGYQIRDEAMRVTLAMPRYVLEDTDGDGVRDFVIIGKDHLEIARHPKPRAPPTSRFLVHERAKLPELRRLELPPNLYAALEVLAPGSFADRAALLEALRATAGAAATGDWSEHVTQVAEVLEEPVPAFFPERVPIAGLAPAGPKEAYMVHTVGDMDGDGVPDLIHMKSTDEGDILDQRNQLRWYPGSRAGRRLGYTRDPKIFFSEGPAFAELVFPTVGRPQAPELFLATTEVSLLAIIRALTLNTVSLDLYVYPWRDGTLTVPPPVQGTFTFELKGNDKKNRPMLFLADLNGDGQREYLFNMDTDTLTAFAGRPQGPNFEGRPLLRGAVELPLHPSSVFVRDLDGDKREELILWYTRYKGEHPLRRTLRVLQYEEAKLEKIQD